MKILSNKKKSKTVNIVLYTTLTLSSIVILPLDISCYITIGAYNSIKWNQNKYKKQKQSYEIIGNSMRRSIKSFFLKKFSKRNNINLWDNFNKF